jgi:2-polyprenyl-6-methoxyphenol hydroxylase-like FAD-dependent oxidoreductase
MQDILVVGAGPVGLTMAAELARHRIRCRIIDRLAQPLPYCRAIGVTPRTLEVWDDMGIARAMVDAGLWLRGMRLIRYGAPPQDLRTDLSDLPYGQLGIPQYETERILIDHLAGFGIKVERPVTAVSVCQDSDAVQVGLQLADGGREDAEFRYVVGCDGAGSAVRQSLGIPFEGDHFPMEFMLGDVSPGLWPSAWLLITRGASNPRWTARLRRGYSTAGTKSLSYLNTGTQWVIGSNWFSGRTWFAARAYSSLVK